MRNFILIAGLLTVFLSGCSGREVLLSIDGTVPVGVDLTGNWKIRARMADEQERLQQAIRRTDGVKDTSLTSNSSRRKSRNSKAGLVYVFLETGAALKITQTAYALYVSFDRSVVEEFRFGDNRMISVGAVQAQRVTGWVDGALTVETLDKNSMKLTESYRLTSGGQILQRTITFRSKDEDVETILQEFDRID